MNKFIPTEALVLMAIRTSVCYNAALKCHLLIRDGYFKVGKQLILAQHWLCKSPKNVEKWIPSPTVTIILWITYATCAVKQVEVKQRLKGSLE